MSTFYIDIPRHDHSMTVRVNGPQEENKRSYELCYNEQTCGSIIQNEHGIWFYEPHEHAGLLLNPEEIQHLGKEIKQHIG
jgi:hypothetical protein